MKSRLEDFVGNQMTSEEKSYRLNQMEKEIEDNNIDIEFIPYLNAINKYDFIMTTQCCTGHEGFDNLRAHVDFRSSLPTDFVIDRLLRLMEDKYNISISLMTESKRLRYVMWLDNNNWRNEINYFISLLKQIKF